MAEKVVTSKAKVFILHIDNDYLVRPATLIIPPGEEVTFKNLTEAAATLLFPKELFNGEVLPIAAGGKATVKFGTKTGAYPYTAVVPSSARIALGNSAPIVIIDP